MQENQQRLTFQTEMSVFNIFSLHFRGGVHFCLYCAYESVNVCVSGSAY